MCCAKRDFFAPTPLTVPQSAYQSAPYADSVTVQAGKHYKHGKLYSFLFGNHYRDVWATPVRVKVLDLRQEKGGLRLEKKGGSMQSTSFTLSDNKGHKYSLRSIDKDPAGSLPYLIKRSVVADFMRDQTAALNPYAALMVPPLARAAGIPHATPELVYLPADTAVLGKFVNQAGDKFFMLEEKMEYKGALSDTAGVTEVISTKKLLKKRFSKNKHQVDQLAFARARLFDLFLNDRDRHQGQWHWAVYKQSKKTIYRPVPEDRDQAFYRFADGVIPRVFGRGMGYQKFISFRNDFGDLKALAFKSQYIDRHFLSEVTSQEFDSIAQELKKSLTDEVIQQAVQALPKEVYGQIGERTAATLKSRRDLLPEAAKAFYKLLAKEVHVTGSDDEEHFIVKRLDDDLTEVKVMNSKNKTMLYSRVFDRRDTNEIKLFGLGDDDVFEVSGEVKRGIKVTITGGLGEDEITDKSKVKGLGKHTIIKDTTIGSKLSLGPESKNKTSRDVRIHSYDREGIK